MQRYEKYKDSGLEWIGDIPEGWEVKKLKYLLDKPLKYGANESALHEDRSHPRYIRITDFGNDGKLRQDTFKSLPPEIANDYILDSGDILFARSGATVGKTFQFKNYEGTACFAGYLIKASPKTELIESDFLYAFTKTSYYERWKESTFNQATIQNIGADKYAMLDVPLPSRAEQTAIANYLDRKTAEIDQLIAQKERLLCLYEEEKTAIINQAVTQGINPDVKPKDSGIDWLGEIPEHWEIKKLKYVTSNLISGPFGSSLKKEVYVNKGYKIYGQEQVIKNDMSYGNYYISEDKYNEMSRYKITKYDILISCVGTFGKILLVPDDFQKGIINPRLIKLSPIIDLIEPIFLSVLLKSPASFYQFDLLSRGGTMGVINLDLLKQLVFSIPPLLEQTTIVHHIETETTRINAKITKTQKIIDLQKEYRTALISEVVTGKIKVTQEVAL